MSYKDDFNNTSGWNCVDTNRRLNTTNGKKFINYLKQNDVETIIRYYASNPNNSKTITKAEAKLLQDEGFSILPVFQDRNRLTSDFGKTKGKKSGQLARSFAERILQPEGTTILFAVDADFSASKIRSHIVPYFEAIKSELGNDYEVGVYGSGTVLQILSDEGLVSVKWLSMSRAFTGTKDFFYSDSWGLRQLPLPLTHDASGIGFDKNRMRLSALELGAFSTNSTDDDGAHLGEEGGSSGGVSTTAGSSTKYVSTEGLNFRETPNGAVIRPLTIAEVVKDLGEASVSGWRDVEIGGDVGVVFNKYLRKPSSSEIESLIQQTVSEWVRFGKGTISETADPQYKYIGEMWEAIGLPYDGQDTGWPWSAAFISYVVRNAGNKYSKFKFSASHSVFSNDAIKARYLERTDRPFWGYRITERKPKIGDIIHRNRGGNNYTFDYAENHSNFNSHSDIVVEVTSSVARVMGGNVANTVTMERYNSVGDDIQEYELNNSGFLKGGQKIIALLANRAAKIT